MQTLKSDCLLFECWLHHLQTSADSESCLPKTPFSLPCLFLLAVHYFVYMPTLLFGGPIAGSQVNLEI